MAQNLSVESARDDVVLVEVRNQYPAVPVAGGIQLTVGDSCGGEH